MHKDIPVQPESTGQNGQSTGGYKRPYQSPVVTHYGDVRDITLGGSPGTLESGFETMFFP